MRQLTAGNFYVWLPMSKQNLVEFGLGLGAAELRNSFHRFNPSNIHIQKYYMQLESIF
jgi:hypothetical protein